MNPCLVTLVAFLALAGLAPAQGPRPSQPSREELKAQFQARDQPLRDLKHRGLVGETLDGYLDFVDAKAAQDERLARLVSEENRDRRALYRILADEINAEHPNEKVKATAETVAGRNAARNVERAGPDEWIRVAKSHWIRVKDYPRFKDLTRLKTQGKVGETGEGLVAIVHAADRSNREIARPVEEENMARAAEYEALAAAERVEASVIARRMAKRNFENARIGDLLQDEASGPWRRK